MCVEPGHVRGYAAVEAGRTWIGGQVISVVDDEGRTLESPSEARIQH